jgi:decaprenylphospho-beta-D-erythro-pentofuranosid-2-ulose 2-reductase
VLLLGGTSELGLEILGALGLSADSEVLLAGRDEQRMAAAGKLLGVRARTLRFDATALDSHETLIDEAFAGGDVDLHHRGAVLDRCGPAPPGQLRVRGGQVRPGRLRPRAGRLAARQRVQVLLVRPGFVIGRMTAGLAPAPLATTPAAVGAAVAARLRRGGGTAPAA